MGIPGFTLTGWGAPFVWQGTSFLFEKVSQGLFAGILGKSFSDLNLEGPHSGSLCSGARSSPTKFGVTGLGLYRRGPIGLGRLELGLFGRFFPTMGERLGFDPL